MSMESEGFARTDRSQAIAIQDVPTHNNDERRDPLRPEHRVMWMASPDRQKARSSSMKHRKSPAERMDADGDWDSELHFGKDTHPPRLSWASRKLG